MFTSKIQEAVLKEESELTQVCSKETPMQLNARTEGSSLKEIKIKSANFEDQKKLYGEFAVIECDDQSSFADTEDF